MNASDSAIYYLTGTGNSLSIARRLRGKLAADQLRFIPGLMGKNSTPVIGEKIVGFVFPVYFARIPEVVRRFIQAAEFSSSQDSKQYIFAVANGSGRFGSALKTASELLYNKGAELSAGFRILMPCNHPCLSYGPLADPRILCNNAVKKIDDIVSSVLRGERSCNDVKPAAGDLIYSFLSGQDIPHENSVTGEMDRYFWLNENCVNCGLCVRLCPADNIEKSRRRPLWQNRCIGCFSCYNNCPWKAIQVKCSWKIFGAGNVFEQKPRYRHPDISVDDLILQKG